MAIAFESGVDPLVIGNSLSTLKAAPGRLESIDCGQNFLALVDWSFPLPLLCLLNPFYIYIFYLIIFEISLKFIDICNIADFGNVTVSIPNNACEEEKR